MIWCPLGLHKLVFCLVQVFVIVGAYALMSVTNFFSVRGSRTVISRPLMPFGGESSLLTSEDLMANPTPASLLSSSFRPDQKKVYPALFSVNSPSSANLVSLRATMWRLYLAISLATRAVLLSGLFAELQSSSVRTFHAPIVSGVVSL